RPQPRASEGRRTPAAAVLRPGRAAHPPPGGGPAAPGGRFPGSRGQRGRCLEEARRDGTPTLRRARSAGTADVRERRGFRGRPPPGLRVAPPPLRVPATT